MSETRHDEALDTIEHLDFAPACDMDEPVCGGQSRAAYVVTYRCDCRDVKYACMACVQERVSYPPVRWFCYCGWASRRCHWLEIATLHPIGGAS